MTTSVWSCLISFARAQPNCKEGKQAENSKYFFLSPPGIEPGTLWRRYKQFTEIINKTLVQIRYPQFDSVIVIVCLQLWSRMPTIEHCLRKNSVNSRIEAASCRSRSLRYFNWYSPSDVSNMVLSVRTLIHRLLVRSRFVHLWSIL